MILKVNELKHALQMVAPAFQGNNVMPILDHLKIETSEQKVTLTQTNLTLTVIHSYSSSETNKNEVIMVEYKSLYDYMKMNNNVIVELVQDDSDKTSTTVHINSGSAKIKLPGEKVENCLKVEIDNVLHSFELEAEIFDTIQKRMMPFADSDELKPATSSAKIEVNQEVLKVTTTQMHIAARLAFESGFKGDPVELLLPRYVKHLADLFQDGNIEVLVSDNKMSFSDGETTLIGNVVDARFPDFDVVLKKHEGKEKVNKVNKSAFINELKIASPFTPHNKEVQLTFKAKTLGIKASDVTYDKDYQNTIEAECSEDLVINLPIDQMLRAAQNCQGDTIELHHHSSDSIGVIVRGEKSNSDNYLVLVMPIKEV